MGNYFEAKQKEELDSGLLFLLKDDQPDQNLNRFSVDVYNFDTETKKFDCDPIDAFHLQKSGIFNKKKNMIMFEENKRNDNFSSELRVRSQNYLINLTIETDFYYLHNPFYKNVKELVEILRNPIWININTYQKGYKVEEGDIFRIGEFYFRIQENNTKRLSHNSDNLCDSHNLCRICFGDVSCADNPLINPCKCIGSVKYVHRNCLKEWINPKIKIKENVNYTYIKWKKMICELCRSQYKYSYSNGNSEIYLKDFINSRSNYIILEKICIISKKIKGIFFFYINKSNCFKIGTGLDNELILTHKSISKKHVNLFFMDSNLYVKDLNSEFGSYCLMRDGIYMDLETESSLIQIDEYLFHFNSNISNSSTSMINEILPSQRLTPYEEEKLRAQIKADIREQKEDTEFMKNNFQLINSLVFPNDDLFYNEMPGLNYF